MKLLSKFLSASAPVSAFLSSSARRAVIPHLYALPLNRGERKSDPPVTPIRLRQRRILKSVYTTPPSCFTRQAQGSPFGELRLVPVAYHRYASSHGRVSYMWAADRALPSRSNLHNTTQTDRYGDLKSCRLVDAGAVRRAPRSLRLVPT